MRRTVLVWIVLIVAAIAAVWWTQLRPREAVARVTLYFAGPVDGGATVVPVERTVRMRGPEEMLRLAFEELLAGPSEGERAKGLTSEIPAGTRLRGLSVRGGVAIVDLTAEIASGGGSSSMLGRLWQIVYTGTQLPQASQVRLLIEGEERRALGGEGAMIDKPIARPQAPPRF